jgi:hypothetical protein
MKAKLIENRMIDENQNQNKKDVKSLLEYICNP